MKSKSFDPKTFGFAAKANFFALKLLLLGVKAMVLTRKLLVFGSKNEVSDDRIETAVKGLLRT